MKKPYEKPTITELKGKGSVVYTPPYRFTLEEIAGRANLERAFSGTLGGRFTCWARLTRTPKEPRWRKFLVRVGLLEPLAPATDWEFVEVRFAWRGWLSAAVALQVLKEKVAKADTLFDVQLVADPTHAPYEAPNAAKVA